ncbi:MAG TPA: hypothetical protein VGH54_09640 [Mycobacterium sp.]|uniref:hypothetical protein n=1 Tax=Mycobacterium sp. TaxID=1785 RepID=UPI002F41F92D
MKDELIQRIDALYRRGLMWPVVSDLRAANDPALVARVEALSDDDLRDLNRLDAAWRNR